MDETEKLPSIKEILEHDNVLDTFSIQISDSQAIELNKDGICKITQHGSTGFSERKIFMGQFKPRKKLKIEGKTLYEIETHEKFIGNVPEIIKYLRSQGGVVSNYNISDAINALLTGVTLKIEEGHAALGVYNDHGKLKLCLDPYYITDEQKRIGFECQISILESLCKDSIQQYINILDYWNEYETAIAMSNGIMAPFAFVLREQRILFCNLFHSSQEPGLGKSLVGSIFSQDLFGVKPQPMGSVFSDFRLADTLDCFCGPIVVDEALHFPWNGKLGDKIKQSAERPTQDKRGTSNLSSRRYLSRLVPFFTANGFPIDGKADLVRFFRVEFDQKKKTERSDRKKSKQLIKNIRRLRPIGFRLVEHELCNLNYSVEELLARIEGYADQIVEHYSDSFVDSRRPTSWGIVYEGLKAWERICKDYDVKWVAPTIERFCKDIVSPIESVTFESEYLPIEDFIDWFQTYLIRDEIRGYDYVDYKSKDHLWIEKTIKYNDKSIDGYVITRPILNEYKKQNRRSSIKNLGDLARSASSLSGIPLDEIYDPKRFKIGGQTKIGVFLSHCLFSSEIKGNSVTEEVSTGGKNGYIQDTIESVECNQVQQDKNNSSYKVTAINKEDSCIKTNEHNEKEKYIQKVKSFLKKYPKTKFDIDKIGMAVGLAGLKGKHFLKEILDDDINKKGEDSFILKHDEHGLYWSWRAGED